jgi:hypothetical protein
VREDVLAGFFGDCDVSDADGVFSAVASASELCQSVVNTLVQLGTSSQPAG